MALKLEGFIERTTPLRALGVKVSQDGGVIGRHVWEPVCRRNIYSASKSFTAAAVGIAYREGLLSLRERLVDAFWGELPREVNENLEAARVRDLLTMCLGQEQGWLMGEQRVNMHETNWVRASLAYPFTDKPGTKFVYNNVGPYLAGVLVQRRAGCNLTDYLYPRLFQPLGMYKPTWEFDPKGYTFGAGGLFLSLDELHSFGELCLNMGMHNGKPIMSDSWVHEFSTKQVDNGSDGYGYLFWRGKHNSYRADGKYAQFSIVFPDKGAVVTIVAECRDADAMLDAVYEEIWTQL